MNPWTRFRNAMSYLGDIVMVGALVIVLMGVLTLMVCGVWYLITNQSLPFGDNSDFGTAATMGLVFMGFILFGLLIAFTSLKISDWYQARERKWNMKHHQFKEN